MREEQEKEKKKAGKKKNKRKSLVHALITQNAKAHQSNAISFPFPNVIKNKCAKIKSHCKKNE